jgi:hypothetical protein
MNPLRIDNQFALLLSDTFYQCPYLLDLRLVLILLILLDPFDEIEFVNDALHELDIIAFESMFGMMFDILTHGVGNVE